MIKAAHTGMDVEQVVDNILAASDAVAHRIPGKWENVQGKHACAAVSAPCDAPLTVWISRSAGYAAFHIKTHDSVALPIYASLPEVTALSS